jgi:hypothetical protein
VKCLNRSFDDFVNVVNKLKDKLIGTADRLIPEKWVIHQVHTEKVVIFTLYQQHVRQVYPCVGQHPRRGTLRVYVHVMPAPLWKADQFEG